MNEKILEEIKEGETYCSENYDIFWDSYLECLHFQHKHAGYGVSVDEFLNINDLDNFIVFEERHN